MKKRLCIWQVVVLFVIALFLIPAVLMAESGDMEYTIKKGDTLWTISSGHLKDPLLWPKLWRANTNVHNPHLIYPNQVIVIPAELLKDKSRAGKKLVAVKGRNIPMIERQPIVPRDVLLNSGYFSRSFVPVGKIASRFPEAYSVFGNDTIVHIQTSEKLLPDTKFYICDMAEPVRNPVGDREIVGYLVQIKGVVQITGEENGNTMAKITENYREIYAGDVIMKYFPFTPPYEPVVERTPLLSGTIVRVGRDLVPAGKNDVVYINRGSAQGIEIGDKFKISAGMPPHAIIGSMQVFSVFDDVAVGVITKAEKDVVPGDTFGN
jgi:hypothetical protein